MRMKIGVAFVAFFVFLAAPDVQAAPVRIALDTPPNSDRSGPYVWAASFAETLKSSGFEVREYPRGTLGGESERLGQTRQGLLEINMAAVRSAGSIDKLVFGLYLPYLFEDDDHQYRAIAQGGLKRKINVRLRKAGIRILAFTRAGGPAGIFNTKRPIRSVADMAGLRLRALDASQIALFKAWGASGTIVSWAEVPHALQTGIADGYLNPSIAPLIFGHTGFIRHFTDAGAIIGGRLALVSLDWYRDLSARQRDIVDQAVDRATAANRAWLQHAGPRMRPVKSP